PNLSFAKVELNFDLAAGEDMVEGQIANAPEGVEVVYTSSNPDGLGVDKDGSILYLFATGEYTITATSAETDEYLAGEASYTVIVTDSSKKPVVLKWSVDAIEVMEGEEPETVPTLSVEPAGLEDLVIEYTSTDENVAFYLDGELAIGTPGTAVITAKATGDYDGEASFEVTVTEAPKLGAITVNGQTADENGDIELTVYVGESVSIHADNARTINYTDLADVDTTIEGEDAVITFDTKGMYSYYVTSTGYNKQGEEVLLTVKVKRPTPVIVTTMEDVLTAQAFDASDSKYAQKTLGPTESGISYSGWINSDKSSSYIGFRSDSNANKGAIAVTANDKGVIATKVIFKQSSLQTTSATRNLKVYGSMSAYTTVKGLSAPSAEYLLGSAEAKKDEDVIIDLAGNTYPYIALFSTDGALQVEYIKIEYTSIVSGVDASKVSPVYSEETFNIAANGEGGFDITITHDAEYDDITVHYLHTPAEAAQVAARRVVDHGNFIQAASEDGVNHTFTVPGPGTVEYYGYHADTDTKGKVESFAIDGDGNTTSIESIMLDGVDPEACYDLQGRRVVRPVRGLFISNGRKVYVK
ncbi:MAG: hypothetical protein K2N10_00660, partial [Muribaculaceae bacterium]|nr:hypothetical protein [Muribaculaceae bacterium]